MSQQIKRLEHRIKKYDRLVSEWEDTVTLCEMAQEEDDASLLPEVTAGYDNLEKEISCLLYTSPSEHPGVSFGPAKNMIYRSLQTGGPLCLWGRPFRIIGLSIRICAAHEIIQAHTVHVCQPNKSFYVRLTSSYFIPG